tara:strand:- start:2150 stop:2704 length:555 start_codon:yes stop_codon:yes gene_type:complete
MGCNKNLTEEEKKALWEQAQTTGEIINRSGTIFNPDADKELALRDAQTRLQTGGGLFGQDGGLVFGDGAKKNNSVSTSVGMPINPYLWKASIETIDFMPLSSTDPFAGTIITDWYTSSEKTNERCKLNIFINGIDLKTDNLKVLSFCQLLKDGQWVNTETKSSNNNKLENAILNKAKKLKLKSG